MPQSTIAIAPRARPARAAHEPSGDWADHLARTIFYEARAHYIDVALSVIANRLRTVRAEGEIDGIDAMAAAAKQVIVTNGGVDRDGGR